VTVKAIVDWARAIDGCSGVAIYAGDTESYRENVDARYATVLLDLIKSSGVRRVSAAARGFTFTAFAAGDYLVLLKVSGRFPALPALRLEEPEFVDPSRTPSLPSQDDARREAEAALRHFGLL
jgi:hypothetical protein